MDKIAITGIGIVSPAGIGKQQFIENIISGKSFIRNIERFDASEYPVRMAGYMDTLNSEALFSERLLKKMDRFSQMALIASEQALLDAGLQLSDERPETTGIFIGNAIGGWLYAETELRDMYCEGREGVSPYMASAWFPAAPLGQVSIYYQIKGFSKTVVADRASSSMAIGYAAKTLNKKRIEIALGGGTEAPVTPYALLCCTTAEVLSTRNEQPGTAYRPFDNGRSGCVIGEGAGMVVMETELHAKKRNAGIYATIAGYASTCDGSDRKNPSPDGVELARAVTGAMADAAVSPGDIDYISCDGLAVDNWDTSEIQALKRVFGDGLGNIPVSCPKSMFGNLLGASGAVDLIATVLSMEQGVIPPIINCDEPVVTGIDYVNSGTREKKIDTALVISRGRGGINTALIVERNN